MHARMGMGSKHRYIYIFIFIKPSKQGIRGTTWDAREAHGRGEPAARLARLYEQSKGEKEKKPSMW